VRLKRFLAIFVAAVLLAVTCSAVFDKTSTVNASPVSNESAPNPIPKPGVRLSGLTRAEILALVPDTEPSGQITWGTHTIPTADMVSGWTILAPNVNAINLMHGGMCLTATDRYGFAFFNPIVVKNYEITRSPDGSETLTVVIYPDNLWSDGTPITAYDYVFGIMLYSSPELTALGASTDSGAQFNGFEAFRAGETRTFSGIRLYSETTFSITSLSDTPKMSLRVSPSPKHVIAPDVLLADSGYGATLCDNFTEELLEVTFNAPYTGYRFAPKVTAGPYRFVSFCDMMAVIVLKANPYFAGTFDGFRPRIETLIIKPLPHYDLMDYLERGDIDMVVRSSNTDWIYHGLTLSFMDAISVNSYIRNGYTAVGFHADHGPTQFAEVRQAIAWLLDREEIGFTMSEHAVLVNSGYSRASWEFQQAGEALEARLTNYSFDPQQAIYVLEAGGWNLDNNGDPFVTGNGNIRHKRLDDGSLMPLVIQWATPDRAILPWPIYNLHLYTAHDIGMHIEKSFHSNPISIVLRTYDDEPFYHMFTYNVTVHVDTRFWFSYNIDSTGTPVYTFLRDQIMHDLAQEMSLKDLSNPYEAEQYLELWVELMVRHNYLVPQITLFTDYLFDFHINELQGWEANSLWGFQYAIVRAYLLQDCDD